MVLASVFHSPKIIAMKGTLNLGQKGITADFIATTVTVLPVGQFSQLGGLIRGSAQNDGSNQVLEI